MPDPQLLDPQQLDPKAIRRAFDKAALTYDRAAALQAEVRRRLLERLEIIRGEPCAILDLGAATGATSQALKARYPRAEVFAVDLSPRMLAIARDKQRWLRRFARIGGRADALPLRDACIDWCVSNLALAWSIPPDAAFREVQRVLKPGGLFTFTTFGPDTLRELRSAWSTLDQNAHVHRFIDMHDLGDALLRNGFAEPVMDVERIVLTYATTEQLFRELKGTGATTATQGRTRHLGQRQRLRSLAAALRPSNPGERLAATFEIVYGQAWRGTRDARRSSSSETVIPVASLRGRRAR